MSKKYNTVKNWYDSGVFSKEIVMEMIRNAVKKKWITEDEYEDITDEPYKEHE